MAQRQSVDVRGLSCPQPALRTTEVLRALSGGSVEVLVDSGTSCENVTRIAQRAGWSVTVEQRPAGEIRLVLKK